MFIVASRLALLSKIMKLFFKFELNEHCFLKQFAYSLKVGGSLGVYSGVQLCACCTASGTGFSPHMCNTGTPKSSEN